MRVVVLLRPTNRRGTKGEYTAFRKALVAEGFSLLQPEVFMKAVPTRRASEHALRRLEEAAPGTGVVCALTLTERQYSAVRYLTGAPSYQETAVGSRPTVEL